MKQERIQITYVSSRVDHAEACDLCAKLVADLPVEFQRKTAVQEIFPLLSMPHQQIDFVVLDADDLHSEDRVDMFDLIRTLSTLIACTVSRVNDHSRPKKRNTKIVVLVGPSTEPKLFKELLSMSEIKFFAPRYSSNIRYEDVKDSIQSWINDGERVPKLVNDLIKVHKVDRVRDQDQLTLRQQQVYELIITRGSSNKHIAKILSISESTVKLHIGAILKKYGLRSRTQLAVFSKKKIASTEVQI